jgi:chromosome segregation ATPase
MKKYIFSMSIWLIPLSLFGCTTTSNKRWMDMEQKLNEYSRINQVMEKRIDDLSRSISLLVNDGNRIHNKIDDILLHNKNFQQNIQELRVMVKGLDECLYSLETDYKTMEGEFNKRIHDIQQTKIELSNRLEMIRMDMRNEVKKQEEPHGTH